MSLALIERDHRAMNVLITGGTGSLGTALTRSLLAENRAKKIVIYSRDEQKQAHLADVIGYDPRVKFFLGDVRDSGRLHEAMYRVNTIIHCAALKRVDKVAHNPHELFKTNIDGTVNVVRAANERGIGRVLVISSDKAVAPSTSYGVSKLAAEFYAVQANAIGWPRTRIAVARYGNVLNSRGSVLECWRARRAAGQPLTITDDRCTRFLMTLPQAAAFVRCCLECMTGGEVFVPELPAALVTDLAEAFAPGHPRRYVGLRAGGEKLHEELISEHELTRTRASAKVTGYIIAPAITSWPYSSTLGEPWGGEAYRSDDPHRRLTVEQIRALLPQEAS